MIFFVGLYKILAPLKINIFKSFTSNTNLTSKLIKNKVELRPLAAIKIYNSLSWIIRSCSRIGKKGNKRLLWWERSSVIYLPNWRCRSDMYCWHCAKNFIWASMKSFKQRRWCACNNISKVSCAAEDGVRTMVTTAKEIKSTKFLPEDKKHLSVSPSVSHTNTNHTHRCILTNICAHMHTNFQTGSRVCC